MHGRILLRGLELASEHALWDIAHWRANRVVSRSFAEWCAVFDFIGGVSILIFPAI
jgi:hypothetical protein